MRKLCIIFAFLFAGVMTGQETPVKIVFDVTTSDPGTHEATIRHVKFMSQSYPDSKFQVVMYSSAMNMVLPDKSTVADDITKLAANDNISFKVCEGTMKRYEVEKGQLVEGVETVADGILEIITKQAEGWGYIKEARN